MSPAVDAPRPENPIDLRLNHSSIRSGQSLAATAVDREAEMKIALAMQEQPTWI